MDARRLSLVSLFFLLLSLSSAPVNAQDTDRRTFEADGFDAVSVSVYGTAHIRQGDTHDVAIDGPPDILDAIVVEVDDQTLKVQYRDRNFLDRLFSGDWFDGYDREEAVDVYVTLPTVRALSLRGTARLIGETPLSSDDLLLSVSGTGSVDAEVDAQSLQTNLSGAGDVSLRGTATSHSITISGAGEIVADDLETETASIQVSGAGECRVHVTRQLDVSVSGAGSVRYKGSPRITQQVSGVGSVKALR